MSWSRRGLVCGIGAGLALLGPAQRHARAAGERQAAIIARALSYERTLGARTGQKLLIAIVYDQRVPASTADARAWLQGFDALEGITVNGNPIEAVTQAWDSSDSTLLRSGAADVLLVCEGMREQLGNIASYTGSQRILSVGSTRAYLDYACSLGVFAVGEKLRITVNLSVAEREHVKFSSRLLELADIVR